MSCYAQNESTWSDPYELVRINGSYDSLLSATSKMRICDQDCSGEKVVYARLIVSANGSISEYEIVKGVSHHTDSTALSILKNVKYIPAKRNGKLVESQIMIPIPFLCRN